VDERTGRQVWKFETSGPVFQRSVTIHDNIIYFGSWDCNVYAITASNRKLVWKFPTSMSTPSSIEVEADTKAKTAEMVLSMEDGRKETNKYRGGEGGGAGYGINMSQYGAMDKGYTGRKKRDYI
jgi:outer membrane protein assembly factor BamB